jgi:hypothetical protein
MESGILMTWEDGKSWLSEPLKVIVFFDRRRPRELFQTHPPRCSLANGGGSPPSFLENRKGLFFSEAITRSVQPGFPAPCW